MGGTPAWGHRSPWPHRWSRAPRSTFGASHHVLPILHVLMMVMPVPIATEPAAARGLASILTRSCRGHHPVLGCRPNRPNRATTSRALAVHRRLRVQQPLPIHLTILVLVRLEIDPKFATRTQLATFSRLLPQVDIDGTAECMRDALRVLGRRRDLLRNDSSPPLLWFGWRVHLPCGPAFPFPTMLHEFATVLSFGEGSGVATQRRETRSQSRSNRPTRGGRSSS